MGSACRSSDQNSRGSVKELKKKKSNVSHIGSLQEQIVYVSMKGEYDARWWEGEFDKWILGEGSKPGNHPNPDHWWNKCPELHDVDALRLSTH